MSSSRTPSSGRITALEPQVRHPDRVNLYLDGRFACGLSQEVVARKCLCVGQDLTSDDLQALLGDEEVQRVRDSAYLLLSYRARSHTEIEGRLLQKGFDATLVKRVLEELVSAGLIDDTDFAQNWVRNRQQSRPRGKSLLRWELRQKGVASATTEAALETLTPEQEVEAARTLALRRMERETNPDPAVTQRRIIGFLQRRGYRWETIREALASLEALDPGDEPWEES
jgi:regulatory protein